MIFGKSYRLIIYIYIYIPYLIKWKAFVSLRSLDWMTKLFEELSALLSRGLFCSNLIFTSLDGTHSISSVETEALHFHTVYKHPTASWLSSVIGLYHIYWGRVSHLNPGLVSLAGLASQLALRTPVSNSHTLGGLSHLPGIYPGARSLKFCPTTWGSHWVVSLISDAGFFSHI